MIATVGSWDNEISLRKEGQGKGLCDKLGSGSERRGGNNGFAATDLEMRIGGLDLWSSMRWVCSSQLAFMEVATLGIIGCAWWG